MVRSHEYRSFDFRLCVFPNWWPAPADHHDSPNFRLALVRYLGCGVRFGPPCLATIPTNLPKAVGSSEAAPYLSMPSPCTNHVQSVVLHRLAGCGMLECACDGGGQYCRRVSVILKNLSAITSLGGNNPIAALL